MEDTTPLICDQYSNSIEQVTVNFEQVTPFVSLDEMIEQSLEANFGCAQFVQAVLVSLLMVFDAQQAFLAVYTTTMQSQHGTVQTTLLATQAPTSVVSPRLHGHGMVLLTIPSYHIGASSVLARSSQACLLRASSRDAYWEDLFYPYMAIRLLAVRNCFFSHVLGCP
ncbi:hypothetical protein ACOSQ4_028105 [Xanthoceras sorbifolium]